MKKLISILTALSFVTVTGINVVACGQIETLKTDMMHVKVMESLGLADEKGTSYLEVDVEDDKWNIALLEEKIDATKMLDDEGKAKNKEVYNFLTSDLKLKANNDNIFDSIKLSKIILTVIEIKPILEKEKAKDFFVKGGTVFVQWQGALGENIGVKQAMHLKETKKGLIANKLPKLSLAQFNRTGILEEFKVGGSTEKLMAGEIQDLLRNDATVKRLKSLNKLVSKGALKITIRSISTENEIFQKGDTMTIQINFGNLQFAERFILEVPEV